MLPSVQNLESQEPMLASVFARCQTNESIDAPNDFDLFEVARDSILPSIRVRQANVEDCDDLEAVFRTQNEKLLLQFGDYYLASLISNQNDHEVCFVAEATDTNRAVGLLSLTSNVAIEDLIESFDLTSYQKSVEEDAFGILPLKIIFFGPSGTGKSTQCKHLIEAFDLVYLSIDDMLRAVIQRKSDLGDQALANMDSGHPIPDTLMIQLLLERMQQRDCQAQGWLLDGYPLTFLQAESMLIHGIFPDLIVHIDGTNEQVNEISAESPLEPVIDVMGHLESNLPVSDPLVLSHVIKQPDDQEDIVQARTTQMRQIIECFTESGTNVLSSDAFKALRGPPAKYFRATGNDNEVHMAESIAEIVDSVKQSQQYLNCVNKKLFPPPRIIIMGAPASGKGTQCHLLVEHFQVIHLSTGDILRASILSNESLGLQAKAYMDAGSLVPDSLIIDVILERVRQSDCMTRGWLLDGFPRTEEQAKAMITRNIIPNYIFVLQVPDDQVVRRIAGRRVDPVTGRTYHVDFDPPADKTVAARVIQRSDDTETTIRYRLETYHQHVEAVLRVFQNLENDSLMIVTADGMLPAREVEQTFITSMYSQMNFFLEDVKTNWSDQALNPLLKFHSSFFAISMLCIDSKYDTCCLQLLQRGFEAFPCKNFALLTLPSTCPEPSVLSMFTIVPAKSLSSSSVLYLMSRGVLSYFMSFRSPDTPYTAISLERYSTTDLDTLIDRNNVSSSALLAPFVQSLDPFARAYIFDEFLAIKEDVDVVISDGPSHLLFLIVEITSDQSTCIGYLSLTRRGLSDRFNASELKEHFVLDPTLLVTRYYRIASMDQLVLSQFVLKPMYAKCAGFIMQEAMRICRKTCFFYPVCGHDALKSKLMNGSRDILFQQFPFPSPRRRIQSPEELNDNRMNKGMDIIGLIVMTKRLFSERKVIVNHRIVIVGVSDTSITMLEKLVTIPYLYFTNITLVSPNGLEVAGQGISSANFVRRSLFTRSQVARLCLERFLRVSSSKVVRIDRVSKAVLLSDRSIIPYDSLILTTGLQDQTCHALGYSSSLDGERYVAPKIPSKVYPLNGVLCAQSLERLLAQDVASQKFVVFGMSWLAIEVLQKLLETHIPGSHIIHVAPNPLASKFEDAKVRSELEKHLKKQQIATMYNKRIEKLILMDDTQSLRGVQLIDSDVFCGDSETSPKPMSEISVNVECDVLICCQDSEVDVDIFRAIHDCGLVYDGRLVVNSDFCTSDNSIFAAGPMARFSRRFTGLKSMQYYNSKECGQLISNALRDRLDPFAVKAPPPESLTTKLCRNTLKEAIQLPPVMRMPVVKIARVLGNQLLVEISAPQLMNALQLQSFPTEYCCDESASEKQSQCVRYVNLMTDSLGFVQRLLYLGNDTALECQNLECFVGLHESYLNSMKESYLNGFIRDWIQFLREKWAVALLYDQFNDLQQALRALLAKEDTMQPLIQGMLQVYYQTKDLTAVEKVVQECVGRAGKNLQPNMKKMLEARVMTFLSQHRDILDMYFVPKRNAT